MTQTRVRRRASEAGSLRAEVERMVSASIVSGQLRAGTVVSVPSLASQFDVSATPVREAMIDLQHRGFVEPVPNKGFRVTAMCERDVQEITQLRVWLEAPAMAQLAEVFDAAQIGHFRDRADSIVRAVDEGDLVGYLERDAVFHHELLALLGNTRLVAMIDDLREQTRMAGLAGMVGAPELRRSASEHHRILDLLLDRDALGVEDLIRRHVGQYAEWGRDEADASLSSA